ncbi:MAG: L,D-transpeptidase family protein [Deltaproteobacteria bacterium]|nr:L,D-transpeptidase family protein [Deltaproteobacteria bacterium]MCB9785176.1 L,D-transpeptidase family protein [Deltaproteobacteria bacterium]
MVCLLAVEETEAQPRRGREALVGVAVAGMLLGALTAAVVHSGAKAPATGHAQAAAASGAGSAQAAGDASAGAAAETREIAAAEDPLMPLVLAIEAARAELNGAPDTDAAAPETAMAALEKKAISKDGWLADLRLTFLGDAGAGALVDAGGATALGRALLDRLGRAADHGLDPASYGMPGLGERVAAFEASLAGAQVEPPPGAGAAGPVLVELLRAPRMTRAKALERLREVGGSPDASYVSTIAEALARSRSGPEVSERAAALDAELARELLRHVLDFTVIRRAGPFRVTRKVADVTARKKTRRKLLERLHDIAAADEPEAALAALDPPHPFYRRLLEVYAHYRQVAERDCAEALPTTWRIRPETNGPEVQRLQERLACEGYYTGPVDGRYGDALFAAVADYQRHHELEPDGMVFEGTLRSLNVPMQRRAEQLALTLQRWRESPTRDLGDFYIRVNLPAFELQVVDGAEVTHRHRVIVGTNRLDDDKVALVQGHINRTRLFTTRLYQVIANPSWILPVRVEKGEMKAKLAEDPDYLEKIGVVKRTLDNGREVLVQGRGEGNVLGKVKFLLEESNAIYLHDTDKRELFRETRRDFSHGCIRVQKPLELAELLLVRDGWDRDEVRRSLGAKTVQRGMDLHHPVPLVTEYMTVDVAEDGGATFLTDIYGYDADYAAGELPPKTQARWGSPVLRPSWVPAVPEEVVEGWRRKGKPAPHDYDPKRDGG